MENDIRITFIFTLLITPFVLHFTPLDMSDCCSLLFEVHGLAQTIQEHILTKVTDTARKLDLPELSSADIHAVHRLPSKPQKNIKCIAAFLIHTNQGHLTRGLTSVVG